MADSVLFVAGPTGGHLYPAIAVAARLGEMGIPCHFLCGDREIEAKILGTTTFPESVYFSAEVHGTEGGAIVDAALDGTVRIYGEGLEERLNSVENGLHNIVEDVVSCLQTGTELRVDGREGRRTVALLEDLYRSAREGRPLDCLPPTDG